MSRRSVRAPRVRHRRVTPRILAATLATAVTPTQPPRTLGTITLLPHQQDAADRLRTLLREHGGALLADDVGLGKTFVAIAVARHYATTHVIAPAGLVTMWQAALARAHCAAIRCHSLHGFPRASAHPFAAPERTLVVIDEAHLLRNPATQRYRAVAHAVAGCDVLLLSATPLHNRPRDLDAMFALFRGSTRHGAPVPHGALTVRRDVTATITTTRPAERSLPAVVRHAPMRMPQQRELLSRMLALPAPLPAHDGAVAGALIRLGLLRAWCSSDAALVATLRHRLLRGEALRDALHAGRHPTNAELRTWVVGDAEGQLAFPELLAAHQVESGSLLDTLGRHLAAIRDLLALAKRSSADQPRADALRSIARRHGGVPVVAFSQYTRTVQALYRALADIAGVGLLTSGEVRIASGRIPRRDMLQHFAPLACGKPPPPPHQRVMLLLATDLIAEGVNLQDAGVVVHLDLPWTAALLEQRVGRCVRLGSPHATVHVYALRAQRDVEEALRLTARLSTKSALARRARRTPDAEQRLRAILEQWRSETAASQHRPLLVASMTAATVHACALVLLRTPATGEHPASAALVTVTHTDRGWRVRTHATALLPLLEAVHTSLDTAAASVPAFNASKLAPRIAKVRGALQRWHARVQLRATLQTGADSAAHHQLLRRLDDVITRLTPVERARLRSPLHAARQCVLAARGSGAEQALMAWQAQYDDHSVPDWLSGWQRFPALAACVATSRSAPQHDTTDTPNRLPPSPRIHAILFVRPVNVEA
jgi:superfamily II DNA or RNA helicase